MFLYIFLCMHVCKMIEASSATATTGKEESRAPEEKPSALLATAATATKKKARQKQRQTFTLIDLGAEGEDGENGQDGQDDEDDEDDNEEAEKNKEAVENGGGQVWSGEWMYLRT